MVRDVRKFVAIDFETANYDGNSTCEVGLVKAVGEGIVSEHSFLIRPPSREFVPRFTELHGIAWKDVRHAPTFHDLWPDIYRIIEDAEFLAAHNASFDQRVLASTCEHYAITAPSTPFVCSMTTARNLWSIRPTRLPDVCSALEIPLGKHHRALDDARACAKIILRAHSHGVRRAPAPQIAEHRQLELLPKTAKTSTPRSRKKLTTAQRTKQLGNWGEKKALSLLYKADFEDIENLNDRVSNHPFADVLARRGNRWFLIGVKTRNKLTSKGNLNSTYNVRKKGKDLKALASEYNAELAWVAIQVDPENRKFNAFLGTVDQIEDIGERFSIPMSETYTVNYECLAQNEIDRSIKPEWSNQQMIRKPSNRRRVTGTKRKTIRAVKVLARKKVVSHSQKPSDVAAEVLGFRPGTKTHRAVSMYLRRQGATTPEISNVNGRPYLNCLKQVEAKGHRVEKKLVQSTDGKMITSYRIIPKY